MRTGAMKGLPVSDLAERFRRVSNAFQTPFQTPFQTYARNLNTIWPLHAQPVTARGLPGAMGPFFACCGPADFGFASGSMHPARYETVARTFETAMKRP